MAAGSIVVDLLARTGSFETDINRSTKAAEKRIKEFATAVKASFAGNLLASFAEEAIGRLANLPKQIISGLDALNDISDATGASIENISALEDVALRTGNSFESVSGALVKFNQQLKDTDPANKTSQILKSIGLDADKLRQIDPAEALHQVAVALGRFADDGDKARVVQELFGKSVREVAPMLKDLAEQETLHATVTTAEAKAAEEFNKQLAQMQKNSMDLARSIAGDLLPELNGLLKAFREGGAVGAFLGIGGMDDPGKKLVEINDKLSVLRKNVDEFGKANPLAQWWSAEDLPIMNAQIAALEKEQKFLQSLQSSRALTGLGDTSDALSRRLGDRPGIGAVPLRAKKGPTGKDPDADFKTYLNNLQQQIQKVNELTVSEKLLDDLRRGSLTATPAQQKQLTSLAQQIDAERSALAIAKERQQRRNKEYEDAQEFLDKTDAETRQRLDSLLSAGPQAQLERQRADLMFLSQRVEAGLLDPKAFEDAATGMLGLNQKIHEGVNLYEELGTLGLDALHAIALGGEDADQVFKRLLLSVADLIFQIGVVEPLMAKLRESMKGTGGSSFWQSVVGAVAGSFGGGGGTPPNPYYGGARAGGGDVLPGRAYDVGEFGPERFIPRTAGSILPASESDGADWTVINQTTGRVDRATELTLSPRQKALLLQEAVGAVAVSLANANSPTSESLKRHYNVRQHRP